MKRQRVIVGGAAIIAGCAFVLVGSSFAANLLLKTPAGTESCSAPGPHQMHVVTIEDNKTTPNHTLASRCDRLTIVNADATERLMAFGPHDDHVPYDGITERLLKKNQSFTITLAQAGTYTFHDHFHDDTIGSFTVKE